MTENTTPVRTRVLRIIIPFVIIPLIAAAGMTFLDRKRHLIVSMCAALSALLLFYSTAGKKAFTTRRMVIISIMTALCFIGRFIPFLKPVAALTIITALYLGPESGFLTGSLAAFLSDFYFGQGPWTVFQMLAWGLIGMLAGIMAKPLKQNRILLLLYGLIAGISYSFIMDIWTVLAYSEGFSLELYLAALTTAVPYTISYAVSNVLFLALLADPFGEKLERIKKKYGV